MLENLIVLGLVAGALFFVGRSLYRAVSGKAGGCACGREGASCCAAAESSAEVKVENGSS